MAAKKQSANRPGSKIKSTKGDTVAVDEEAVSTLIAAISDLAARREPDFFKLADVLAAAKESQPEAFATIISRARVSRRRAYYLLKVRERFQPFMCDAVRLRAIGWTKLKILSPFLSVENADELFVRAEKLSAYQLGQSVRGADEPTASRCVLLYLTPEQYALYERAVRAHGADLRGRQLVGQEQALMALISTVSD